MILTVDSTTDLDPNTPPATKKLSCPCAEVAYWEKVIRSRVPGVIITSEIEDFETVNREKIKDILELIKHLACSAELIGQLPSTLRETIINDLDFLPTPQEMYDLAEHLLDFVNETIDRGPGGDAPPPGPQQQVTGGKLL